MQHLHKDGAAIPEPDRQARSDREHDDHVKPQSTRAAATAVWLFFGAALLGGMGGALPAKTIRPGKPPA